MFCLTVLFPEFNTSSEWQTFAFEQEERCVRNLLIEDGAEISGCPHYHNVNVQFCATWMMLCEEAGVEIPKSIRSRIEKGMDYVFSSYRPSGKCVPWADSYANYGATISAIVGYRAFHEEKWIRCLKKYMTYEQIVEYVLDNEAFALLEMDNMSLLEERVADDFIVDIPRLSFQKAAGQVNWRTSWEKDALYVFFGCAKPYNNHAHVDMMSFEFVALGRSMIVDPGVYTYDYIEERKAMRSAYAHSCLLIDGKQPWEYPRDWEVGPITHNASLLNVREEGDNFQAQGIHTFYFPAVHERLVSIVEGKFLVVWDRVSHMEANREISGCRVPKNQIYNADMQWNEGGGHHVAMFFNVDSLKVVPSEVKGMYFTEDEGKANLCICTLSDVASSLLLGYASDLQDELRNTTRVCYEESGAVSFREYITLFIPFDGKRPAVERKVHASRTEITIDGVEYCLKWDEEKFTYR